MSGLRGLALATVAGIVLGGIVHGMVVFGMPAVAERDAFSRLRGTINAERSELIAAPGGPAPPWLPRPDPAIAIGACAYNLEDGPIRIATKTEGLLQSLSFHARGGALFFAVTDRAAVRGALELVVMTRAQLDEALAREDEDEASRDVRIVAPENEGFVVVRALAAFPSQREEAAALARSVSCTIEPGEGAVAP